METGQERLLHPIEHVRRREALVARLEDGAVPFQFVGEGGRPREGLQVQGHGGGDEPVERVREIVRIHRRKGLGVRAGDVHGSSRERIFQDAEEGEVLIRVGGRIEGGENLPRGGGELGADATIEGENLHRRFPVVEQLADGELVLFPITASTIRGDMTPVAADSICRDGLVLERVYDLAKR